MVDRRRSEMHQRPPKGPLSRYFSGADDEIRTRDPHLGKVMLYQLSHVRNALGDVIGVTLRTTTENYTVVHFGRLREFGRPVDVGRHSNESAR